MPLFTNYIPEGIKFENEEDAINFFKESLVTETPLGELYDKFHNEVWGKFNIQVTGDAKSPFVALEHLDLDNSAIQLITLNHTTQAVDFDSAKTRLNNLIRTSNIIRTVVEKKVAEVYERIENNEEGLIKDRLDLTNHMLHVELRADNESMTSVNVVLKDKENENKGVIAKLELTIDEQVNTTHLENMVESMFISSAKGKAHVSNGLLQVGDTYLDYLIDYAIAEGKEIEFNLK